MEIDNVTVKVPPIKSQGKKTLLVGWIKETLDDLNKNENYLFIEPFVGTGVVGFNLAPKNAVFSDLNPHLINFYNGLKNNDFNSNDVKSFLTSEGGKLLVDEKYYYEVRERFNKDSSPLDFLFLSRSCFNGMMRFNKKGKFNVPFCKKPTRFAQAYVTKITNQVLWLEKSMKENNWNFELSDFRTVMEQHKNNKDAIYYLDAPYVLRNADYFNGWGEDEELSLYTSLKEQQGQFILSTWYGNDFRKNPYIDKLWSEFEMLTKGHTYHVGAKVENRNEILEALIIKRHY